MVKSMDDLKRPLEEINQVSKANGMKLNERRGKVLVVDKGIRVELGALFRAIGENEREEN